MSLTKTMPASDYLLGFMHECYWSKDSERLASYYDSDAEDIDRLVLNSHQQTLLLLDELIKLNSWNKTLSYLDSIKSHDYFLIYFACMCLFSSKEIASVPLTVIPSSNTCTELFILIKKAYTKYMKRYIPDKFSLWWNLLDVELNLMSSIS